MRSWYGEDVKTVVPESVNKNQCTHIIYANGVDFNRFHRTFEFFDSWDRVDVGFSKRIAAFKQKGIKVFHTWKNKIINKNSGHQSTLYTVYSSHENAMFD